MEAISKKYFKFKIKEMGMNDVNNKQAGIESKVMKITPTLAQQWLDGSAIKNRPDRKADLNAWIQCMKEGKWELNGESIIFSNKGNILDGHERLKACVKSGTDFSSIVVTGIDERVMPTIDDGTRRSLADALSIENPNLDAVARTAQACLGYLFRYCLTQAKIRQHYKPTWRKRAILLTDHDLLSAVRAEHECAMRKQLFSPSILACCRYIGLISNQERTLHYVEGLRTGEELKDGDPALTVREATINVPRRHILKVDEKFRSMLYGLQAAIEDKQLKRLKLPRRAIIITGAEPEKILERLGILVAVDMPATENSAESLGTNDRLDLGIY